MGIGRLGEELAHFTIAVRGSEHVLRGGIRPQQSAAPTTPCLPSLNHPIRKEPQNLHDSAQAKVNIISSLKFPSFSFQQLPGPSPHLTLALSTHASADFQKILVLSKLFSLLPQITLELRSRSGAPAFSVCLYRFLSLAPLPA